MADCARLPIIRRPGLKIQESIISLRTRRRRLAGAEGGSSVSLVVRNRTYGRMRATEHAPRGQFDLLQHCHCLTEIIKRGAVALDTLVKTRAPDLASAKLRTRRNASDPDNPSEGSFS